VTLSLDGIGRTHDAIRGVDGAFGRVMENYLGLKALSRRHDFSIGFSCLVQKENIANGGAFALLDAAEGALLPITFPIVYGKDIFQNRASSEAWAVEEEALHKEVIRFYEEALMRGESGGLLIDNGMYYTHVLRQLKGAQRTLPCLFKEKKACVVDSDGSVYLCDVTQDGLVGNIYKEKFDDIWSAERIDAAHAKMVRHCARCLSSCVGSGRYQLMEAWQSGGMGGIAKLSLRELRKRMKRISRLIKEYRYAVIPRL
jgi:radical SAM protein with 4Fe4S-binding SPASM domain